MLKKIAFLFLVVFLFSCNQHTKGTESSTNNGNNKPEDSGGGATVVFSSLQEGRGAVVATVDGKEIKSGDKVAKGKVVSFTATPQSNRYIMRRWQGASYDESSINEALLKIKDEKATYAVRADFGSIVDFIRIDSGEVKGVRVVPEITKEQLEKIIEGNQTINVKGPNVTIVVASKELTWNANSFKVNGSDGYTMAYGVYKSAGLARFDKLEVGKPFDVEFTLSARDTEFKFKLKLLKEDGLVDVPHLKLAIDEKPPEPRTETTLQDLSNGAKPHFYSKKDPEIEVSSNIQVIKEVVLEEAGKAPQTLTPAVQNVALGKLYFTRFYVDDIPVENAGTPREIKITIKPIDATAYSEVVWVFCLKQFDIADSAEFQGSVTGNGGFEPAIIKTIEWYNTETHTYVDDYGSLSIIFTARTVSPQASVHYQIVGLDGKSYNGSEEKIMTNNGDTSHTSEKITLFDDKPTMFKVWVVGRNGKKRNDARGVWNFTANPVNLMWGYTFSDNPNKLKDLNYSAGYDVVKINKGNVKNGKIYLAFGIWDAFTVGTEGLAPEQKPFVKMKMYDDNVRIEWYSTEVNISPLIDDNKESMEVFLPILEKGVPCFKYKVTLRFE